MNLCYLFDRTAPLAWSILLCSHWMVWQQPSSLGSNELWEKHWMSQRPAIQTVINPKPAKGHFVKLTSRKISVEFYIYRLQLDTRYIQFVLPCTDSFPRYRGGHAAWLCSFPSWALIELRHLTFWICWVEVLGKEITFHPRPSALLPGSAQTTGLPPYWPGLGSPRGRMFAEWTQWSPPAQTRRRQAPRPLSTSAEEKVVTNQHNLISCVKCNKRFTL